MKIITPASAALSPDGTSSPGSGSISVSFVYSLDGTQRIEMGNSGSAISILTQGGGEIQIADASYLLGVGGVPLMIGTSSLLTTEVDMEFSPNTIGPVLRDTVTNSRYRLTVASGVFTLVGPL